MTQGMKLERQRGSNRTFYPATAWYPKTMDLMVFLEKSALSVQEKEPIYLRVFVCFSVHVNNKNLYVCVDHSDGLDLKHIISYLSGFIKAYLYIKHTHIYSYLFRINNGKKCILEVLFCLFPEKKKTLMFLEDISYVIFVYFERKYFLLLKEMGHHEDT